MSLGSKFSTQFFNAICVVAHWGSAIVTTIAAADSNFIGTSGRTKLFIMKPVDLGQPPVLEEWANPSIFSFLAAFTFITGCFHLYYYLNLSSHDSALRFLEYSITATIMAAIIAILTGINDVYTLIGIEGLTMTTMVFGYLEEKTAGRVSLTFRPFWLGWIPYLVAWIIITWHFIRANMEFEVPEFVIAIYAVEVLLFSIFAWVQWVYVVKPDTLTNRMEMEGWYNFLSLTSKMLLVWLAFGGLAART